MFQKKWLLSYILIIYINILINYYTYYVTIFFETFLFYKIIIYFETCYAVLANARNSCFSLCYNSCYSAEKM